MFNRQNIFSAVFLLFLFGGTGVILFRHFTAPSPQPTVSESVESPAIYRNAQWRYSFSYPPDRAIIFEEMNDETSGLVTIHYRDAAGTTSLIYPLSIRSKKTIFASPQEYLDALLRENQEAVVAFGIGPQRYQEIRTGSIGGEPFVELYGEWASDVSEEHLIFVNDGNVHEITFPIAEENATYLDPVENNLRAHDLLQTLDFS